MAFIKNNKNKLQLSTTNTKITKNCPSPLESMIDKLIDAVESISKGRAASRSNFVELLDYANCLIYFELCSATTFRSLSFSSFWNVWLISPLFSLFFFSGKKPAPRRRVPINEKVTLNGAARKNNTSLRPSEGFM